MSKPDKNKEKINLRKLFSDREAMGIFFSKLLIVLAVIPTIVAGIVLTKNATYKKEIIELTITVNKQADSIKNLSQNIEVYTNTINSMQQEIIVYQKKTKNIADSYKALKKDKSIVEKSILNDILIMRKNIYSLYSHIIEIEKQLSPKNKARKDN